MKKGKSISLKETRELLQVKVLPGPQEYWELIRQATQELIDLHGREWFTEHRARLLAELKIFFA